MDDMVWDPPQQLNLSSPIKIISLIYYTKSTVRTDMWLISSDFSLYQSTPSRPEMGVSFTHLSLSG